MSELAFKCRTVTVELPDEAFRFHSWQRDDFADQLRLPCLLDQVRQRRLGHAKAADLAGMSRALFIQLMGRHHISPFDYDSDELDAELR